MSLVNEYIAGLNRCLHEITEQDVSGATDIIYDAFRAGGTVYIMGNGGSAATASHMVCDLTAPPISAGLPRIPAIALTDNFSVISARANDINYESIFTEQLVSYLKKGDIVIGISASGNSPNIINAIEYANTHGARTVGFAGFKGGRLKDIASICITISCADYGQVEDTHLALGHIISYLLKAKIMSAGKA